jgi:hypothetical protein
LILSVLAAHHGRWEAQAPDRERGIRMKIGVVAAGSIG